MRIRGEGGGKEEQEEKEEEEEEEEEKKNKNNKEENNNNSGCSPALHTVRSQSTMRTVSTVCLHLAVYLIYGMYICIYPW